MLKLNYSFKEPALLAQALTHKSANKNHNERLEFLGDSLVNLIIAEALHHQFIEASEGQLSRLRASLVKKNTLAAVARDLNIGEHLHLGSGELKSGGYRRDSILADAVEAIIAAIYLDSDFECCRRVVLDWFDDRLTALCLEDEQRDYKSQLQEYLQAKAKPLPEYHLSQTVGKDHNRQFAVECRVQAFSVVCVGSGNSKKSAEQEAAKQALMVLEEQRKP